MFTEKSRADRPAKAGRAPAATRTVPALQPEVRDLPDLITEELAAEYLRLMKVDRPVSTRQAV